MSQQVKDQEQQQSGFPPQHQDREPGIQADMVPQPVVEDPKYRAAGKLEGKVALITGGDSGIGEAVAILFAKEGADVAIVYLNEHGDADRARKRVEELGRRCILISGDVGDEAFCRKAVEQAVREFGHLEILVNNAAEQHPRQSLEEITAQQFERTFRTNIFGYFFMAKAALPHLKPGSAIINTASITAYQGSGHLIDYASTKGAIVAFTRSLAEQLTKKGIRVNAVAPGPIWTPLIPSTFPPDKVASFGKDTPMGRAGQPSEVATSYVFLASDDASYIAGQVIHPNGGQAVES
ncbi:MAG TPA: SDR family oxidoreductase [Armatimonadota bacterium]|nr:SDR family oxidoreductase [Armatimonadota bacterium]